MCLHSDSCSGNQGAFSITLVSSSLGDLWQQMQEEIIEGTGAWPQLWGIWRIWAGSPEEVVLIQTEFTERVACRGIGCVGLWQLS